MLKRCNKTQACSALLPNILVFTLFLCKPAFALTTLSFFPDAASTRFRLSPDDFSWGSVDGTAGSDSFVWWTVEESTTGCACWSFLMNFVASSVLDETTDPFPSFSDFTFFLGFSLSSLSPSWTGRFPLACVLCTFSFSSSFCINSVHRSFKSQLQIGKLTLVLVLSINDWMLSQPPLV